MSTIRSMLDKFIEDGIITRDEHDQFVEQMSADGKIDDDERSQISRMFQLIREGKLKVVDHEREKFDALKRKELAEKLAAKS